MTIEKIETNEDCAHGKLRADILKAIDPYVEQGMAAQEIVAVLANVVGSLIGVLIKAGCPYDMPAVATLNISQGIQDVLVSGRSDYDATSIGKTQGNA